MPERGLLLRLSRLCYNLDVDFPVADSAGSPERREGQAEGTADVTPSIYCPVCSQRLEGRKCKLICPVCGYYMSCSDYV